MKKTLLYRLFGVGKLPVSYISRFETEGMVLTDEGIKGTLTLLNFRSPNRAANWKRQWFTASIAMTNHSLLAFQYSNPVIDSSFMDARFRGLNFSVETNGALLVAFDASLFHDDWRGSIEYRFFTSRAREFHDKLTQKQSA